MNTVQYSEWKIAVDVEKTKKYYNAYVINDTQANRNFAEYCKGLSKEEKNFFEAFEITPECCEIEHIGVSKKKKFPCGGYYLFCGSYIEHPSEGLMTVEEFAENGFEHDRPDPRIDIGMFQFDFQCEDHIIKDIPEDIPEGFICVKFWCENMKWLLSETPEEVMYEPPHFWEIGRIIKEKQEAKKRQAIYLEESKQSFTSTFEKLGIAYSELTPKELEKYKQKWVDAFSPENADKKEIRKLCLDKKKYTPFLWHIFSYEFLDSEKEYIPLFESADKSACVLISNVDGIGFALTNAGRLTAEVLDGFVDVTVSACDFSWTYSKTHESMCGPYFYRK